MDERLAVLLEPMDRWPGASKEELAQLRQYVGVDLPSDYLEFLRWSNGGAGAMKPYLPFLAQKLKAPLPTAHILFSTGEVIEHTESDEEYAEKLRRLWPGYLLIGASLTYPLLIDIRSQKPATMEFVLGSDFTHTDRAAVIYRSSAFLKLVEYTSPVLVDLTEADLRGADLRGANLFMAQLWAASLTGADLTGADLRCAGLYGTNLTDAKLANVQLTGALYDLWTRWPEGFDPQGHGVAFLWTDPAYPLLRHTPTGEFYALRIQGGRITGCIGPRSLGESRQMKRSTLDYDQDRTLVPWATQHIHEFKEVLPGHEERRNHEVRSRPRR